MEAPSPVRRLTLTLFAGQSLASAGVIAGLTVATIAGAKLSGQAAFAGVPSTLYLIGSAVSAYPASRLMQRWGRRLGLVLGYLVGIAGAALAGLSIQAHLLPVFLAGLFLMGASRGALELSRYAAAEIHPVVRRAKAISTIVLAGTVGAIFGPIIVGPMGRIAESFHADALAGPWLGTAVLFAVGLGLTFAFLRPDPADFGRGIDESVPQTDGTTRPARSLPEMFRGMPARVALLSLVIGQSVMVMLMAITSLHMTDHRHTLGDVSWVIAAHSVGMFGLSFVSGFIADRFGRGQTIGVGAAVLVAASLLAPVSQLTPVLALALFLLGWGWNLCYVAGSSLLTDSTIPEERGSVQGAADLVVNFTSAASTLGSGVVFALAGYAVMGWFCAAVSFLAFSLSGWFLRSGHALQPSHPQT